MEYKLIFYSKYFGLSSGFGQIRDSYGSLYNVQVDKIRPIIIEPGCEFIVTGMDGNLMPRKDRVVVVSVSWVMLPLLNMLDEEVTVRFKNGRTMTVGGISLRLSQQSNEGT